MKQINFLVMVLLMGLLCQNLPAQGFGFGPANTTIPDNGCGSNELSVTTYVNEVGKLDFTNKKNVGYIFLNIDHGYTGDLRITLTSPEGTTITLSDRNGGSGDDFTSTSFASWASTSITNGTAPFSGFFAPEQSMNAFDGEWADGEWTLTICDADGGVTGTFLGASIWFSYENDLTKVISMDFFFNDLNNFGHGGGALNISSGTLVNDMHDRPSRALQLDGSSFASLNTDNGWLNPTQGIAMGAWVKPVSVSGTQIFLGKASNLSNYYDIGIQNGKFFAEVALDGVSYTTDGGNLGPDKWYFLAMEYDPGGLLKIFVNGAQVNAIAAGTSNLNSLQGSGNWIVGAAPYATTNARFDGIIDQISVWNYAVGTTALRQDMEAFNSHCRSPLWLPVLGTSCDQRRKSHNYYASTSQVSPSPTCASYQGGDLWFRFEVPSSGNVSVETNTWAGQNSFSDAGMEIYRGDCDNLIALECNDDDGTGNHSKITLTGLTPGEELKVRVWEYGNNVSGFFTICVYNPNLVALEEALDEVQVKVYPSPTTGPLNLTWQESQFPASVKVFDLSGKQVLEAVLEGGEGRLSLDREARGAYVVSVEIGGKISFHKVIRN